MVKIFAKVIRQIQDDYSNSGRILTQQELADAIGISKQGFTNKMTRDRFTDDDMYRIADYLGMEVIIKGDKEYILKEDGNISAFFRRSLKVHNMCTK